MRLGGVAHAHLIGLTCGMSGPRACYRAQVRMKGPRAPPGGLTCAVTNARATTATNQSNFACNSPECISSPGVRSLSFQRFVACGDSRLGGIACGIYPRWPCRPIQATARTTARPRARARQAPRQAGPAPARSSCASALDDVDGQAALGRLLVLREHVVAGLAHRLDDDVQAHRVPTVAP